MMRRMKMKTTDTYVDNVLEEARRLLWSGSLHEVDQAHNMIAELIKTRMAEKEGRNVSL